MTPQRRPLRAAALRDPVVELRTPSLVPPAPAVETLSRPETPTHGLALAPLTEVLGGEPPDPGVSLAAPDLTPAVDVLPHVLVPPGFPIRAPDVRVARPPIRQVPAFTTSAVRAEPAPLHVLVRAPTPPEAVDAAKLRDGLTRLFRASGAATPGELVFVGVFERMPAGAIASLRATPDGGVRVRVTPRARGRAATLLVGRHAASAELVSVELR